MAIYDITAKNYHEEVVNSSVPVLLDFWASWCGTCKYVSKMAEEISKEISYAKICKINVDEQQDLVLKLDVMTVPTLLIMKDGSIIHKIEKPQPKRIIKEMLAI